MNSLWTRYELPIALHYRATTRLWHRPFGLLVLLVPALVLPAARDEPIGSVLGISADSELALNQETKNWYWQSAGIGSGNTFTQQRFFEFSIEFEDPSKLELRYPFGQLLFHKEEEKVPHFIATPKHQSMGNASSTCPFFFLLASLLS